MKRTLTLALLLAAGAAARSSADDMLVDFDRHINLPLLMHDMRQNWTAPPMVHPAGFWLPWKPGPGAGSAGLSFNRDVPEDIKTQMLDDLSFIQTVKGKGSSRLHQQIFGMVDGQTYSQFFDSRVKSVGMSDCGSKIAVACVQPLRGPWKMWLTQNYIKFKQPQIARLMVVFHESRHTETRHKWWPHANCPKPFIGPDGKEVTSIWTGASLAGEPGCDATPFGSYGSSLIMLKNIQKFCDTCTGLVKKDAGIYADDQLKRIIDPGAHQSIVEDLYQP